MSRICAQPHGAADPDALGPSILEDDGFARQKARIHDRLVPETLDHVHPCGEAFRSGCLMQALGSHTDDHFVAGTRIPKGTHDFDKFLAPNRMKLLLADAGLKCVDVEGIAWSPTRGLHLSDDVRLNYLVAAVHG